MSIKAKVLTLAMLSMTMQQTYVLSQSYDQGYSNYQQGQVQGYYNNPNQGYYSNPNQGYYGQGQGYNIQLNEENGNRGNHEGYRGNNEDYHRNNNEYRGSNDTNRNNRMRNQSNRNSQHDEDQRSRNMRAEADEATPRSYPLGDEADYRNSSDRNDNTNRRADDRNTAYRTRGQNNQNRQVISDNTNVTTSTGRDTSVQNSGKAKGTVIEVLSSDPSFSTLVQAITAAGLLDTLNGRGPFTIFAPNNDAFKKLPADQLNDLLKPENKQKLAAILKYHIIPGKIMAADLVSAKVISVQGKPLDLKVNGAKATVNNASITNSDLSGTNGVVHSIDTVLIPN
jgi:uncharacterized surface protein with fasciclin (FAS1) repeats